MTSYKLNILHDKNHCKQKTTDKWGKNILIYTREKGLIFFICNEIFETEGQRTKIMIICKKKKDTNMTVKLVKKMLKPLRIKEIHFSPNELAKILKYENTFY